MAGRATDADIEGPGVTLTAPPPSNRLAPAGELFDGALQAHAAGLDAGLSAVGSGRTWTLPLERWCAAADGADVAALDRLAAELPIDAAVLDLGCGPGRHSAHLTRRGRRVLGIDTSAAAVLLTRTRGAYAVRADALGPLPDGPPHGPAGWHAVLLLDGNIGIGGDPLLLLCRTRDLLGHDGRVLVELDPAGVTERTTVCLRDRHRTSEHFPWGRLGLDGLVTTACLAGLDVLTTWADAGRQFALLRVTP